jgi:hypothetical protein
MRHFLGAELGPPRPIRTLAIGVAATAFERTRIAIAGRTNAFVPRAPTTPHRTATMAPVATAAEKEDLAAR